MTTVRELSNELQALEQDISFHVNQAKEAREEKEELEQILELNKKHNFLKEYQQETMETRVQHLEHQLSMAIKRAEDYKGDVEAVTDELKEMDAEDMKEELEHLEATYLRFREKANNSDDEDRVVRYKKIAENAIRAYTVLDNLVK